MFPATIAAGDELHLLNLWRVIGICSGHHQSRRRDQKLGCGAGRENMAE